MFFLVLECEICMFCECNACYDFCENTIQIRLYSHLFCSGSCFIQICFVFIHLYWCPARFPYQIEEKHISGAEIAYHSVASDVTSGFEWNSQCAVFSFICSVLSFCPFSFDNCIVFPRFTASAYTFGILIFFIDTVLIDIAKLSSFLVSFYDKLWLTSPATQNYVYSGSTFV